MNFPKITIVTPNFNQAPFLERTILSVLNQGYPNLEYIIIDGGSTDGSVDIIKKYEGRLAYWESAPDKGMYHAIQKGFNRSTGEIMAWINSDDVYFSKSLFLVSSIFNKFKEIDWITANPAIIDEEDRLVETWSAPRWSRYKFFQGNFKWIQQESTFWRRRLWERAGSTLNLGYQLAGDFELWLRFFQHAQLYTVKTCLSGFRMRTQNQKSLESRDAYLAEVAKGYQELNLSEEHLIVLKKIKRYETRYLKIPLIFRLTKIWDRYQKLLSPANILVFRRSGEFEFEF